MKTKQKHATTIIILFDCSDLERTTNSAHLFVLSDVFLTNVNIWTVLLKNETCFPFNFIVIFNFYKIIVVNSGSSRVKGSFYPLLQTYLYRICTS